MIALYWFIKFFLQSICLILNNLQNLFKLVRYLLAVYSITLNGQFNNRRSHRFPYYNVLITINTLNFFQKFNYLLWLLEQLEACLSIDEQLWLLQLIFLIKDERFFEDQPSLCSKIVKVDLKDKHIMKRISSRILTIIACTLRLSSFSIKSKSACQCFYLNPIIFSSIYFEK